MAMISIGLPRPALSNYAFEQIIFRMRILLGSPLFFDDFG